MHTYIASSVIILLAAGAAAPATAAPFTGEPGSPPFADSPTWLAELDPESVEASTDKVYAVGPLTELEGLILSDDGTTARTVDVKTWMDERQADVRDGVQAANQDGALAAAPLHIDTYAEYDDRFVIHSVTEFDVLYPDVLSTHVPEFAGMYDPKPSFEGLSSEEAERVEGLVKEPDAYVEASAELSAAAEKGTRALYEAMADGKGVVRYTRNSVIYKPGKGPISTHVEDYKMPSSPEVFFESDEPDALTGGLHSDKPVASGSRATYEDVVIGWEEDWSAEDECRWDIGVGFVRVTYGVIAEAGLRLPYRLHGTLDPTSITGPNGTVEVEISTKVEPLDGSAALYERKGLDTWSGDEVRLALGAWFGAKVYALGIDWVHIRNPDEDDRTRGGDMRWDLINEGASFQSPLGDSDLSKRFVFDAEETGLEVSAAAILYAGLDLSVDTAVTADHVGFDLDLTELSDEQWRRSFRVQHGSEAERLFSFYQIPELAGTFDYGFEGDDPSARLGLDVSPGLRLVAGIDGSRIASWLGGMEWRTGWWDAEAIRIASIQLGATEGTEAHLDVVDGVRTID